MNDAISLFLSGLASVFSPTSIAISGGVFLVIVGLVQGFKYSKQVWSLSFDYHQAGKKFSETGPQNRKEHRIYSRLSNICIAAILLGGFLLGYGMTQL